MSHYKLATAVLALVAAAGCTKARTEAVIVVTTDGVRVPDDIDTIDLRVADTTDLANPVFQQSFRICGGDVTQGCLALPLNFTLIPGAHREHSARVQVTATRKTMPAIDSAAIFTFADGQSLRLDFVLYANCLGNVDCAVRDQACGPDAMCHPVPALPISGEPDLASNPQDLGAGGDDLAMSTDFAMPLDLSIAGDLTPPRDLTVVHDLQMPDLAGCVPFCAAGQCGPGNCNQACTCSGSEVCSGTTCSPCGNVTQPCCGTTCSGTLHCYSGTCDTPDMASGSTDMSAPADKLLTWTSMSFDSGTLYGVWGSGSEVWAVGDKGTMGAIYHHATGGAALDFSVDTTYSSATTLRAVAGAGADVWAAGDSATIVRYNGAAWGAPPTGAPANSGTYYGIWVGGPGTPSVEIVGGTKNGTCTDSTIDAHYDGTSWRGGTVATNGCAFGAVWGSNLGFIAWPGNEHRIVWTNDDDANEFTYSFQVTSNIYLHGIWGVTKSQMWVVGDAGTIYHFTVDKFNNGMSSSENSSVSTQLNAISGTGLSDLWAVGANGTILHSYGDTVWTKQTNIAFANMMTLYGVYALGPNDVYVVGSFSGNKLILHGQ